MKRHQMDKRQKPICYLIHRRLGRVPVLEINDDHVVWDDNQWSRTIPPNPEYEVSPIGDFELDYGSDAFI